MATQVRVTEATHRMLHRLSKSTMVPVTKIVERLVRLEVQAHRQRTEDRSGTDALASPHHQSNTTHHAAPTP